MATHMAEIEAITSNNDEPTFENTILAYDNSGLMLEQVRLVFDMLCSAELTEQMAAEKAAKRQQRKAKRN